MKSFLLLLLASLYSMDSFACKAFAIRSGDFSFVGKSFDYHSAVGSVLVNKRNFCKEAFMPDPRLKKAQWVSKYGSVTFNQAGKEFAFSGMNEKGLVVEILWLAETKYPSLRDAPSVNESQLIQFILDVAQTTEDAVQQIKSLNVASILAPVHYFICDTKNDCAVVEFLNGEMVVHREVNSPISYISNSTYEKTESIRNQLVGSPLINELNSKNSEEMFQVGFKMLDSVWEEGWSKWQIMYDQKGQSIRYRVAGSKQMREIRFGDLVFSCKSPTQFIDLASGDESESPAEFKNVGVGEEYRLATYFGDLPLSAQKLGEGYSGQGLQCLEK